MKPCLSRRTCLAALGTGAVATVALPAASQSRTDASLHEQRTGIDWGGRPMYLRPYHPSYLVTYYGMRREGEELRADSVVKWGPLLDRIDAEPELTVMLIQAYDDACAGCASLVPEPAGHPWGVGYSCHASLEKVRAVHGYNRRILGDLGFEYGDEVPMRELARMLAERVPRLYQGIGNEKNQGFYEMGLRHLAVMYGDG